MHQESGYAVCITCTKLIIMHANRLIIPLDFYTRHQHSVDSLLGNCLEE